MTRPDLLVKIGVQPLLCDGGMGTQLQEAGLEPGACGEAWNLDQPERVLAIQRSYVKAGSDCLTTNTFGASRIMLERHGERDRVVEINQAGARIARAAFGDRQGWVLGDLGPFGGMMEPYGEILRSEVESAFLEQARALVEGGVDAILVETQTALEELEIGVMAAREAGARCIIGSMAFDAMFDSEEVRTMMGVSPEQAAERMVEMGVDIVALNCGSGVDMVKAQETIRRYRASCDRPLMAQPNAGQPELEDLRTVYRQTPDDMAAGVGGLLDAGAVIVGGCCGSTPAHIEKFRLELDSWKERAR
jgi:5-methyltetrahydrofolate--homocysteine methyltransferase